MTTIVTRAGKGSPLTWMEADTNFTNLNTDKAETASPTFTGTVSGITKTMVGLGNVDNTSDVNKPISTATQTSLNLKVPKDSDIGAATLPSGTTAQRPSTGAGKVRFNSTIGIYEGYNTATSSWESLGSIVNTQTVGVSSTTSENHFWDGSAPNQLSLKRGTPNAPGAELIKALNGVLSFPNQAQSLATNGYVKLPGGLIVQWLTVPGAASDNTFSFPITFPTALLCAVATPFAAQPGGGTALVVSFGTLTNTGGTVQPRYIDAAQVIASAAPIKVIALGY